MAEEAKKTTQKPSVTEAKEAKEAAYTVPELAEAGEQLFKVKSECAYAALKPLKKEKLTLKEARAAVEKFMRQGVK